MSGKESLIGNIVLIHCHMTVLPGPEGFIRKQLMSQSNYLQKTCQTLPLSSINRPPRLMKYSG